MDGSLSIGPSPIASCRIWLLSPNGRSYRRIGKNTVADIVACARTRSGELSIGVPGQCRLARILDPSCTPPEGMGRVCLDGGNDILRCSDGPPGYLSSRVRMRARFPP